MCKKEESVISLKKRGDMLVKLGYAMAAGIISAVLGTFGYDAIVHNNVPREYFVYYVLLLCASVVMTYVSVNMGISRLEQADKLEVALTTGKSARG